MRPFFYAVYSLSCYVVFQAALLWGVAFTGGFVPEALQVARLSPTLAFLIDLVLLILFGVQHSVMARAGFKRWWTRLVPGEIERSSYVLLASLALLLLFSRWQPLPGQLWEVSNQAGRAVILSLFGFGWLLVIVSTFLTDHLALFGLRELWDDMRGARPRETPFQTPSLYRVVRHPMMLGMLIAFWSTPHMTTDRLLFALGMTAYILVGVSYEERDLLRSFGARYGAYRQQVPMLLPRPRKSPSAAKPVTPQDSGARRAR